MNEREKTGKKFDRLTETAARAGTRERSIGGGGQWTGRPRSRPQARHPSSIIHRSTIRAPCCNFEFSPSGAPWVMSQRRRRFACLIISYLNFPRCVSGLLLYLNVARTERNIWECLSFAYVPENLASGQCVLEMFSR